MEMKLTVTQDKREETIDKILKLVEEEYPGIEVTALFTRKLLEETIRILEDRCLEAPLRVLNKLG
jgi:Cobalamin biosynthesis protein CbiK, Co2+ chelatase